MSLIKRDDCKCICHSDAVALGRIMGPKHIVPCCEPMEFTAGVELKPAMVLVPIDDVIIITSNDGGYLGGRCSACGATGWLDNKYGYPFGCTPGNKLVHTADCDLGHKLKITVEVA